MTLIDRISFMHVHLGHKIHTLINTIYLYIYKTLITYLFVKGNIRTSVIIVQYTPVDYFEFN